MKKSYSQKLKDPRWQQVRLKVMERDEWHCTCCGGKDETLNVHHGLYEKGKEPWELPLDTLWTLCESCHESITETSLNVRRLIGRLKPEDLVALEKIIPLLLNGGHGAGLAAWPRYVEFVNDFNELNQFYDELYQFDKTASDAKALITRRNLDVQQVGLLGPITVKLIKHAFPMKPAISTSTE